MEIQAVMIYPSSSFLPLFLYPSINNMSAYPIRLICLCTLFLNPQEARRGREGELKSRKKELGSENVESTCCKEKKQGLQGGCERVVFSRHYHLLSVLAP